MEIRVQRVISVEPRFLQEFMRMALDLAEYASSVMGVETEVFYNVYKPGKTAEFVIFTDFESMAQYEQVFLGSLLFDSRYLEIAEQMVDMITDEPLDALFVHLKPDDYFMNLRGDSSLANEFEEARKARLNRKEKFRYRHEREYCASKGRLREVMKMNFGFMEEFYRATNNPPAYYCTRFAPQRIGCSKLYFDYDECPMCNPAFLEQDHRIITLSESEGLLLTRPIDTLYLRITRKEVDLQSALKQPA
jgi:hypothetical protein